MPQIQGPTYTKVPNTTTGGIESCYTFTILFSDTENHPSFAADTKEDVSLDSLHDSLLDHSVWWNQFLTLFLESTTKHFAKPYTIQNIQKIMKHMLEGTVTNSFPVTVHLVPKTIKIVGGIFWVIWKFVDKSLIIDIPVLEDVIPDLQMEELSLDTLPVSQDPTDDSFSVSTHSKEYDKQRAKELRLKAQLAAYKAELTLKDFYDKYGDEVSDSDSEEESDEDLEPFDF